MNTPDSILHPLPPAAQSLTPPPRFTYPFCYQPHPLCQLAADEVQHYLSSRTDWQEELQGGKMFGVLIVRLPGGELAYLAAFSGLLAGSNRQPWFVPPVFDLLRPGGFFKEGEEQITAINRRIAMLEAEPEYRELKEQLARRQREDEDTLTRLRLELKAAREQRQQLREAGGLTPDEAQAMVRQSQHQKAEYKRTERALREATDTLRRSLQQMQDEIDRLKAERKSRSAALQAELFTRFRLLNARGEARGLLDIFREAGHSLPPAGAGECAAPKLLQQAYLNGWQPVCMAEFWWGTSPRAEVRHHGHYYPACQGKCGPILAHMLQGLQVDPNPMETLARRQEEQAVPVVYEDEWLLAVDKPSGMLTVPGKGGARALAQLVAEARGRQEELLVVHRLDMETSGLVLMAKSTEVQRLLQRLFEQRRVEKQYMAWLDGTVQAASGTISLPLCPDPLDRPRQRVDEVHGKPALTLYRVLEHRDGRTLVAFSPHTGRTHQLRVHAAHPQGLGCPISGDRLYGKPADRLYLHADAIRFRHPMTDKEVEIKSITSLPSPASSEP